MTEIVLVGNPNCGKTTLFNALTGDNQRVGNWPGVTVEKKTGSFVFKEKSYRVTDLPGIYSLVASTQASSQDELIAAKAMVDVQADIIVNVIDASHLERHLYLTSQIIELGKPTILALNMSDVANQCGITIDTHKLSNQLGCPVVLLEAHKCVGLDALTNHISSIPSKPYPLNLALPEHANQSIRALEEFLLADNQNPQLVSYIANRVFEGDTALLSLEGPRVDLVRDADILMADARYEAVHQVASQVVSRASDASEHVTAKIDKWVLHRFWALPIFLATMYGMFFFAINIGGAFQPLIEISTDAIFVQGAAQLFEYFHFPAWLIALLANGVGKGINTTMAFIPVIAGMFFFLAFLELSGYMARAAFVVDKIMRKLGLPGKSFVPMIVGFGCNVPAIMAARTLDSERDRLMTILMSPFMSCSARLAIYAVFVAAFFPTGGQNIVFALYMIGILMAVATGLLLRKTALRGQTSSLVIELPVYHRPSFKRLVKETGRRLKHFLFRAGRLIIPVCVLLGALDALTYNHGLQLAEASDVSLLSWVGQCLTPLFYPMGITQDNWPATVGLFTGMLAKEVVVGSLNTLYAQSADLIQQTSSASFNVVQALKEALWSVPENFSALGQAVANPILASAPDDVLSKGAYGVMYERFDGKAGAFSYLLFILLYVPCVSTMAAIKQEASRQWMWFSVAWSTLVAYAAAVVFYQVMTFASHPNEAIQWIAVMLLSLTVFIWILKVKTNPKGGAYARAGT